MLTFLRVKNSHLRDQEKVEITGRHLLMSLWHLHFRYPKFGLSTSAEMTRVFCTLRRACTDKVAGAPLVKKNRRSDSTWLQTLLVCLITVFGSVP